MNLTTQYLGIDLPHPFLVGASPLIYDLEMVKRLEEAGAAAIVMHSLFEEQIVRENVRGFPKFEDSSRGIFPESTRFPLHPEAYLKHIQRLKAHTSIPIIASLNGIHMGTWVDYAKRIAEAGADALELNLFFTPRTDEDGSAQIESRALEIVRGVKEDLPLPFAVKLAPFYTGLPRFLKRVEEAGALGVVLFNSFFQPDIDIEAVAYKPNLNIAEPNALLLRTRWIATLHGRTRMDLSLSGGVHCAEDAIKGLMAGATTIQLVSSILKSGPEFLASFISDFRRWMAAHQFESIDQLRGILSFMHSSNTEALARAGYLRMLQTWDQEH